MISNSPITARLSARSQASQPAAIMRGPAMPAKRASRQARAQRFDQLRAEIVAGGLAGDEDDEAVG